MLTKILISFAAPVALALSTEVTAQEAAPDTAPAHDPLAWMDGEWRGTAMFVSPQGPVEFTQTERVGPMLGGLVRAVEGKGYDGDGNVLFNAFAVIAPAPDGEGYLMTSWTLENAGSFPLQATEMGYRWEIETPAGTTVYEARFEDGMWRQTGHMVMEGRPPFEFFRMDLTRIGDSEWPAGGAVLPE